MVLERVDASHPRTECSSAPPDAAAPGATDTERFDDEVERLLTIAAQLFSLVERQIHLIESGYAATRDTGARVNGDTVFKEILIHSAVGLDASLHEIAARLADWADGMNERLRTRTVESLEWL